MDVIESVFSAINIDLTRKEIEIVTKEIFDVINFLLKLYEYPEQNQEFYNQLLFGFLSNVLNVRIQILNDELCYGADSMVECEIKAFQQECFSRLINKYKPELIEQINKNDKKIVLLEKYVTPNVVAFAV